MHKPFRIIVLLTMVFILAAQASFAQQSLPSPPAQVQVQQLELNKPIEHELKGGETHAYTIALQAGEFLRATVDQRGIDVIVRVFAPDGVKVAEVDSPNGRNGPEPVALEAKTAGTYRIEVAPIAKGVKPGRYEIKVDEILSKPPTEYVRRRAKKEAVIKWLTSNAVPIKTVEAGNGFEDLQPLKRIFKNVRFVGLGEATHGTREFFQFKHRMLEFLVKEMGFRVFAIEASYAGCRNINDYVMGKTDDGAKALDSQGFWTWNTEEVRAMLDWMRTYNASVPADKKVKFVGFDVQLTREARDYVLSYLQKVAPERVADFEAIPAPGRVGADNEEYESSLETIVDTAFPYFGSKQENPAALKKFVEIRAKYNELLGFIVLNSTKFTLQTSAVEFANALQSVRVIAQRIDAYSRGRKTDAMRDLYMAENLKRFADAEPPGTRFVVWAHNLHIEASENSSSGFGNHLRRFYGNEYYALGFSFNQGGFQAREEYPKDPTKRMLEAYIIANPAIEGSVDWYLAQTRVKTFFVDLRSAAKTEAVSEWLAAPHGMRSIGATYSSDYEYSYFYPITLKQAFDGLVFIDTTTRARPNPSVWLLPG